MGTTSISAGSQDGYYTVHLGASERLTVCVAQPGNGYTSARIAAETFRLQLSYTKIKSG